VSGPSSPTLGHLGTVKPQRRGIAGHGCAPSRTRRGRGAPDLALKASEIARLEQVVGVHDSATREANVAAEAATGLLESLNRQLDSAPAQQAELTGERDTLTS